MMRIDVDTCDTVAVARRCVAQLRLIHRRGLAYTETQSVIAMIIIDEKVNYGQYDLTLV